MAEKKDKTPRVGLTLDAEQYARLVALAEFDGTNPSALAREVLLAHLETRAEDIDLVMKQKAEYEKNLEQLRNSRRQV